MNFNNLKQSDEEIYSLIQKEKIRQQNTLEMIASENIVSESIMEAMGSYLTNKYAEGYPNARYYGGCEVVDKIEQIAIDRACELFGAECANIQPHSGSQANFAVYQAVCKPGDTVLALKLENGGHLTHGSPANFSGKLYNTIFYGIKEDGYIDMEDLQRKLYEEHPRMIIAGASAYPREIEFDKIKKIIDECNSCIEQPDRRCIFVVDMAHIAGLVAAGLHISPVPYADIVTTTTHKTLRGPRGGLILCKEEWIKKINSAVFPCTQGGPLEHIIAAKATCFKEAMTQEFKDYQTQIIKNTKVLAEGLSHYVDLVTGGTDNHLVLVDLSNTKYTGREAQELLEKFHIATNKNAIPNETRKPSVTSGLRIGTAALTTRGLKEEEILQVADIIGELLTNDNIDEVGILAEVQGICNRFPIYRKDD